MVAFLKRRSARAGGLAVNLATNVTINSAVQVAMSEGHEALGWALDHRIASCLIGVAIFWICFVIIDKVTPYDLWAEICEKKNVALAIVVGAMCIAIGLIVSAAVHG